MFSIYTQEEIKGMSCDDAMDKLLSIGGQIYRVNEVIDASQAEKVDILSCLAKVSSSYLLRLSDGNYVSCSKQWI